MGILYSVFVWNSNSGILNVWDDSVLILSVLTGSLKYHRNNVVIIIPADYGLFRAQGSFYMYAALFFVTFPLACVY